VKLQQGSLLGPYEVVDAIGAGGMGEVWRARDTRLDRQVAIKVLPAVFAASAQFRLRFDREAQAISQLEHPNICRLYDVGETEPALVADGGSSIRYLVMEYLVGESLADRLKKGPLPIAEVLRVGQQIASALDAAHRKGIVHRDLKPGNIMLTRSGAKLLDFGLAKAEAQARGTDDETQHKPLTEEGVVLGTCQYMAPEQLAAGDVDSRTDIFALGVVLYEMATGRRAFEGQSRTSLVAAIMGTEPRPLRELQPMTPPALEHVITKCLEKDPEHRWQSAHDIADELRWIGEAGSQTTALASGGTTWKRRDRLAWLVAMITAAVALATITWLVSARSPQRPMTESAILLPEGMRLAVNSGAAISPDGTMIAASLDDLRGGRSLWVRSLGSSSFRQLDRTADAWYPFWSPDSRQIGYFAGGKLLRIDAAGGMPQVICDAPGPRGGTWNRDGTIVFAPELESPLMKVSAGGGKPEPATALQPGEQGHRWPWLLPDGKHFLYLVMSAPGVGSGIYRGSLNDPSLRQLVVNAESAMAAWGGYLFYARDNSIVAQQFDPRKGTVSGTPAAVVDNVATSDRLSILFSVSDDGTMIAQRGTGFMASQLLWVDREGKGTEALTGRELFFSPRISPSGRRLAVDRSNQKDGQGDVWIYELGRNVADRLTFKPENESGPAWSGDERYIYYHRGNQGDSSIERITSGGTGAVETLVASKEEKRLTHVSPDGRWVLFDVLTGQAMSDIWVYTGADNVAKPWLATPFNERGAELSPDGRWIIYQSDESGQNEIYVRDFPDSSRKWLITRGGGTMPTWRGDGREVFYIAVDGKMMAVPIRAGDEFEAGEAVALFDAGVRSHPIRQYDVTPDGTRFIVNRTDQVATQPLTLITNWPPRAGR
jgi:eukaryotic-like serine/threonine-protein kinase